MAVSPNGLSRVHQPGVLDGGARFHPVVYVIFNNASYCILKQRTPALKGFSAEDDRYVAMDLVNPTIDYVGLAKSLGVPGEPVEKTADVEAGDEARPRLGRPLPDRRARSTARSRPDARRFAGSGRRDISEACGGETGLIVRPAPTARTAGAQWIRVFVTQLPVEATLDGLVADNQAVVPMHRAQLESDYSIIQDEPVAGGNGRRKPKQSRGLLPTTRSVVRRVELWEFTGNYDPITHEALCADLACNVPAPNEIGELISAPMSAAIMQSDSVTVAKTGSGNVESADKRISCGNKCVAPYNAGAPVTLTAKPGSGSVFSGWTGACSGLTLTCTVAATGHVDVGARFATAPAGGGGGWRRHHDESDALGQDRGRQRRHHQRARRYQLRQERRGERRRRHARPLTPLPIRASSS